MAGKKKNKVLTLTMRDRLYLQFFYPQKDYGLVEHEMKKDLQSKVWPSKEEMEEVDMKDGGNGSVTWDASKDKPLEVELNEQQVEMLKHGVEQADENKRLNDDNINLALTIKEL